MSHSAHVLSTNVELERRYLGGAMLDQRIFEEHPLSSGCFGNRANREVHTGMAAIVARGERITEDRLDRELAALGYETTRVKRPFQMAEVLPDDPGVICDELRRLAARRTLVEGAEEALRMLGNDESLLAVQTHLAALANLEVVDEDRTLARPIGEFAAEAITSAERAAAGESRATIITGLPDLDGDIDGHDRGDLVVIAGDSGAGKSTTMLLMARAQAMAGERALIVTLEDHSLRWGRRAVYSASGVPIRALKSGDLGGRDWANVRDAGSRIADEAVFLATPLGGGIDEVLHTIRRSRAQHGVTIAYVDYLTAVKMEGGDDRALRHHIRDCLEESRRETSRGAEPFTIVWGSQYKKREDETRRPRNGDLYEAAYIRHKADTIIHLWKDSDGNRHWWVGKHKDESDLHGMLTRSQRTGLLGGRREEYATPPAQGSLDADPDEWRAGT